MSESSGRGFPPQPPPTKSILVYRNGDAFYPGKKFVINQRQTATFESFLGSVTRGIEAPFGAVRHIYTPREGHRIRSLEQFSHGERYVAAGAERLKNIDYLHITPNRPQRMKNKQIRPVVHSKIIVPARWRKNIDEPCTINVFANGDILVPPARILLPKYTLNSWESVLAMVTEKVHLRSGAVHRLFTLDGTPLLGTAELKNNQYYVAVGMEKFRHKPYVQNIPNKGLILDINQAIINEILPPLKRGKPPRDLVSLAALFCNTFVQIWDVFTVPLCFYLDIVFRANDKRKEVVGVSEVQDDSDMKVDLPIDQVRKWQAKKNIRKAEKKNGENSQGQSTDHLQRAAALLHCASVNNTAHYAQGEAVWESDAKEAISASTPQTESPEACFCILKYYCVHQLLDISN
uniref:Doublecortin domain-containing protein n=1 Tax=Astyanax mexicanus TaxID=7994 RepID=A0A3B1KCW6_ASTMX